MQVETISLMDYADLWKVKDSPNHKHVLIHIVRNAAEVQERETALFDIFFIQSNAAIEMDGYVSEYCEQTHITILTKEITGQQAEQTHATP